MADPAFGKCSTCRFFHDYADAGNSGECRRHAPMFRDASEAGYGEFPRMSDFQWCGEYVRREEGRA